MNQIQINKKKTHLIINADDFGYSQPRDRGILELIQSRVCSSVSVIINGNNIINSSKLLKELQKSRDFSIGLHFNLTEGIPVSSPIENLLKDYLFVGKPKLYEKLEQNYQFNDEAIKKQFIAQIQKFIKLFENRPSHIDGHNHIHVIECIAKNIAPLMNYFGIYKTRIPIQELTKQHQFNTIFVNNALNARKIYQQYKIISPNFFFGLEMIDHFEISKIQQSVEVLNSQSNIQINFLEIMCHPGYPDPQSNCQFSQSLNRLKEKQALESQNFKNVIKKLQKLSTFEDLQRISYKSNSMNRILIYSKMVLGSGNLTTSLRLKKIFQQLGYVVYFRSVEKFTNKFKEIQNLKKFLYNFRINLIIGVNIARTAQIIYKATNFQDQINYRVPYLLILAGTDVNSQIYKEKIRQSLIKPLLFVEVIISISKEMTLAMEKFNKQMNINKQIITIQQSTQINEKYGNPPQNILIKYDLKVDQKYIIFPTSFRKVKAVDHILNELNIIYQNYQIKTLIAGPILDQQYYNKIKENLKNVRYLGVVPRQQYKILLKHSYLLINTSQNQGMSCSILEALEAEIPVIARNNLGNINLIQHQINGFIYHSPSQFLSIFQTVYHNQKDIQKITKNALKKIHQVYSYSRQQSLYKSVLNEHFERYITCIGKLFIFTYPQCHPPSTINNQLYQEIQVQKYPKYDILDLGSGTGVFGLIYLSKLCQENLNISITFSDIKQSILGNSFYNIRNSWLFPYLSSITLVKSDMFQTLAELGYNTILANLPQTPFQFAESRLDRNGGPDSLKYNRQLIQKWQFHCFGCLIMLYSSMCWPSEFKKILEKSKSQIIWKSTKRQHIINKQNYQLMEKGLSLYIQNHHSQGRASISFDNNNFYVPAQIYIIKRQNDKKENSQ